MNRNVVLGFIGVVLFGLGALTGTLISNAIFAGSGEASEEISAPTLDPNVIPTASYSQLQATNEALVTALEEAQAALEATPQPTEEVASTEEAAVEPEEEPATVAQAATAERVLFRIAQDSSEARFKIDETLGGRDIVVVGTTDQVAGDVVVDFGNPGSSQIGTIRINVRTLRTDNNFRDDAIRGRILQSSRPEFEFAEFVPSAVSGLPSSVNVGDTIEFQITGDLTLRDVTRTVTFDATVTVTDADSIEGLAATTILYRDFNLTVPQPPNVSFIADEVVLEIAFTANRVES